MKKNNTAEKTVQDAKKLTEALKESTRKSLKDIMNEAIENIINDEDDEKDDELEDSYEVEDVETDEATDDVAPEEEEGEEAEADAEEDAADDAEDEWSDVEDFKVGDDVYDFTSLKGEDDENDVALKVYNRLGDDDQIIVKKEDDGSYTVNDEETGAEYVIELDDAESEDAEPEDAEIELDFDTEDDVEEPELDIDIEVDDDDEEKEELDETDLGYTTKYQKDDAIEGLKMTEPAPNKSDVKMDAGLPKGTERPYGKVGEGEPFDEKVNECGDAATVDDEILDEDGSGLNTKHSTKKNTDHINRSAQNQRHVSTDGDYEALKESAMKIYNKAKQIQEENNKYKGYIAEIKKSLTEAAVLNVSLTQALKLMVENTTTANEKKNILKRFNDVKTINESKKLYETIKNELNESKSTGVNIEKQISVEPKKTLNETKIYDNPSLRLMERMDKLGK